ncbi:MAG TPA: Hsp20/alpha crystallin family protein [Chloroflexaceae bacterium]|nr:Hsp20/alpha crystallin family protein [Chloroflexaceae bacterium]
MSNRKPSFQVFALRQPFVAFESRLWRPAHNLYETDRGVTLVVELAGVDPGNLHVHVHPRHVAVHGVRQLAVPEGIRRVEQMEIGAGPFQLEVPLGRSIDPEQAAARYAAGLLEIELPFAQQPTPRVVVIRIEGGAR